MTTTTNYSAALLFALCVMSSFTISSCTESNTGVVTVYANTTTRYNGAIGEFKKEKFLFNFVADQVNEGSFSWDNVWSFKDLGSANFELFDEAGDVVHIRPSRQEDLSRDVAAVLAMPAHSRVERESSVASHIGNSLNKAFLKLKRAERINDAVEKRVATVIAEQVAKNITSEIMNGMENSIKAIEKSASKAANKQYFSTQVKGFRGVANKISM